MKRLTVCIALLLATCSITQAQTAAEKTTQEVADLNQQLALTSTQQSEVAQIIAAGEQSKETLKIDATLSPEILAESLNKIQAKTDEQIAEKLSQKQKLIFERIASERPKETAPIPAQKTEQPV